MVKHGAKHTSWDWRIVAGNARDPWIPAADVYQVSSGWIVKLELAGIRQEDLTVTLEGNALRVCGRRRDWLACETQRLHSLEITYDRFERRFELSRHLEHYHIRTEYRDGMLIVKIVPEEQTE